MASNPIVGVWKLVSYRVTDSEGVVTYPFGPDAVGYYMFTETGYASVALMRKVRLPFAGDDITGAGAEEYLAAARHYVSYAGKYEVRGDQLIIHPDVSLVPNWVGVDQFRTMSFDGNKLTLSAKPQMLVGKMQKPELTWEKVG